MNGIWTPPLRRLTLGLALVVVATAFEALAVATILPATVAELGGLALYGWIFSAFMLANLIGISVGGLETDRAGPARVFIAGAAFFSGGLLVSGVAPAMIVIVIGRALQGFGAGLLSAVAYASIAQAYAVELQPRMLATLSSAWVIPGLVGPGLASLIAARAGWRWVFLGLVPLPILATVLVVSALQSPRSLAAPSDSSGRTWQSLQLGVGATVALVGLGLHSWPLALLAIACGCYVAVRALSRLLPEGSLFARPGLPAAIASMALLNFAFFGTEAFVPLSLSRVRHAPVWWSGVSLTAAALTWTGGAWLPVRLAGRVSRRTIIVSGLAVFSVGCVGMSTLLSPSVPVATAVVAWGVAGFGMGLSFTTLSAAILEAAEPSQAGVASASLQLAQVLGVALATGIGGAIVAAPFAGNPPLQGIRLVDALMLVVACLAMLTARRA